MIVDQENNFNLKKLCCYGLIVMDCKWLTQLYYFNPNKETIELFGSVILLYLSILPFHKKIPQLKVNMGTV